MQAKIIELETIQSQYKEIVKQNKSLQSESRKYRQALKSIKAIAQDRLKHVISGKGYNEILYTVNEALNND